jgi:hypothetical protein
VHDLRGERQLRHARAVGPAQRFEVVEIGRGVDPQQVRPRGGGRRQDVARLDLAARSPAAPAPARTFRPGRRAARCRRSRRASEPRPPCWAWLSVPPSTGCGKRPACLRIIRPAMPVHTPDFSAAFAALERSLTCAAARRDRARSAPRDRGAGRVPRGRPVLADAAAARARSRSRTERGRRPRDAAAALLGLALLGGAARRRAPRAAARARRSRARRGSRCRFRRPRSTATWRALAPLAAWAVDPALAVLAAGAGARAVACAPRARRGLLRAARSRVPRRAAAPRSPPRP